MGLTPSLPSQAACGLAQSAPGAGMGRKSHTSMSSIVKGKPQAKRLAELRHKEAERKAKLEAEVETWFKQYDFNQDGKLQRDELRALLTYLSPDRPPTEDNLDFLIEKATAVDTYSMHLPGNKNGSVTWHNARATVHEYHEYTRDQNYLDSVFRRFDADGNGTLDATELPGLLEAVAPEGRKITASDVHYIMCQCDNNGDGVISRDEVMPMLARWKHIRCDVGLSTAPPTSPPRSSPPRSSPPREPDFAAPQRPLTRLTLVDPCPPSVALCTPPPNPAACAPAPQPHGHPATAVEIGAAVECGRLHRRQPSRQ